MVQSEVKVISNKHKFGMYIVKVRCEMAAAQDPTTTTIMTMNSLFDSTDNSAQMSREVQQTRIATGTEDGQLARRCPDSFSPGS